MSHAYVTVAHIKELAGMNAITPPRDEDRAERIFPGSIPGRCAA
ncbi:MAG: hypothetical protein JWQ21_3598 [Herminiimonas sp.]|jgi:hypothetical protein|nr:hypothetical protein [Herminiimonas sp.]